MPLLAASKLYVYEQVCQLYHAGTHAYLDCYMFVYQPKFAIYVPTFSLLWPVIITERSLLYLYIPYSTVNADCIIFL